MKKLIRSLPLLQQTASLFPCFKCNFAKFNAEGRFFCRQNLSNFEFYQVKEVMKSASKIIIKTENIKDN